jgi:nucleoside-diphosphate kinase
MERTFVMIKPDGVKKRIIGEILTRFEKKGLYLVKIDSLVPTDEILNKHYAELSTKPFFKSLVEYMKSGMVVPMIFEGKDAVKTARNLMGSTDPASAAIGTIRSDYGIAVGRNVIHGSDSVENAKKEIELWFGSNISAIDHFDSNNYYE